MPNPSMLAAYRFEIVEKTVVLINKTLKGLAVLPGEQADGRAPFGFVGCAWRRYGCQGFALIAVLWLAVILSIIAFSFAWQTRIKARTTANILEIHKQYRLLESALQIAINRFLHYDANKHYFVSAEQWAVLGADRELFWYPRYEPYALELEGEKIAVRLVYPTGRFDVRTLDWTPLRRVLVLCGVKGEGERTDRVTELANAIKDWQDEDSLLRLGGAEDDYYLSLSPAYYCKNGPMQNMEELLLVKGIDRELYAGSEDHPGLVWLCNLAGENSKLDITCAPPAAFALVDGLPEDVVQSLLDLRQKRPILSLVQAAQLLPAGFVSSFRRYFDVLPVDYLIFTAWVVTLDGRPGRTRKMVYQLSKGS